MNRETDRTPDELAPADSVATTVILQTVRPDGSIVDSFVVEGWHEVGAVGEPAFQHHWANMDPFFDFDTVAFYKDPFGVVRVKGIASWDIPPAPAIGDVIFTLPAGYRPAHQCDFVQGSNGAYAQIRVDPAGNVFQSTASSVSPQWLEFSFRAA